MTRYEELTALMKGKDRRKLGNNTYLHKRDGAVAVRLHDTDVITIRPDGSETYNSGGWRTVTTKERMNSYGSASITQCAGIWYIDGEVYADGCAWTPAGITGVLPPEETAKKKKLNKQIKTYCDAYMKKFMAREIPAPSGGDCWACALVDKNGKPALGGASHMADHLEEKYYVPSMVLRACEAFPVSIMAKNIFAYVWNPEHKDEEIPEFVAGIAKEQIGRALRRHVKRELGIAS